MLAGRASAKERELARAQRKVERKAGGGRLEGLRAGLAERRTDKDYEQREHHFETGTSLVVYTDGVVEARRGGRLYGQYRLERLLNEEAGASAPQMTFEIYKDCEAYAEEGLADDVAIVVAKRVTRNEAE